MAKQNLKDAVAWIDKDMTSAGLKPGGGKKDPAARSEMAKHQGQILILNELEYIGEILPLYGVTTKVESWISVPENKAVVDSIFKKIHTYITGIKFSKPKNATPQEIEHQRKIIIAGALKAKKLNKPPNHAFIVTTFEAAKGAKYKGKSTNNISMITASELNRHFRQNVTAKKISEQHQLGHGDKGIAVAEYNVVSRQQLAAKKFGLTKQQQGLLNTIYVKSKAEHLRKINIKHAQEVVANGKLDKNYLLTITMQTVRDNQADKDYEKAFLQSVRKNGAELAQREGSTKLIDAINRTLMWNFKPRPGMTVKGLRKQKIKESAKADYTSRKTQTIENEFTVWKGLTVQKNLFKGTQPKTGKPTGSLQNILGLINTRLPSKIQKNMGSPSLNNVTGKFSSSIEALKIRQTGRNRLPTLQYTYDKDPYQVFETGVKGDRRWATTARDPRLLIDKSIREVARELALGKFTTQRI